jgi:hypothetical protein
MGRLGYPLKMATSRLIVQVPQRPPTRPQPIANPFSLLTNKMAFQRILSASNIRVRVKMKRALRVVRTMTLVILLVAPLNSR